MRTKPALTVVGAVLALALTACGGGNAVNPGASGSAPAGGAQDTAGENGGVGKIANPSDKKGGVLKVANSGDWDTLDPGEVYYAYSQNFARLYARALTMYKPAPGEESTQIVPDLAEGLGTPSEGGKTWTYKLRSGLKYEDGSPITAKDVAYAVSRSVDVATFPNEPVYFQSMLDWPKDYKGPYKSKGADISSAIETPDDQTVVFHLKQPFGNMDELVTFTQTAPVPPAKDDGANYRNHIVSSGPYKFENGGTTPGKNFALVRNDQWDPSTDPLRKALPDRIDVQVNVNAEDLDNQLIAGTINVDIVGTGVQPATLGKIQQDPALMARTDNPSPLRLWYTSINPTVKPLDNIHCRKAILYGADQTGYQAAYGGPKAGGDMATSLIPPQIPGHQDINLYPNGADHTGDQATAKKELAECGQPNGFETNISYRAERPKEKAVAEAFQQSLAPIGIKLTLKPFPQADYFAQYAGNPPYVRKNNLGMAVNGWGADYPDGFGFLSQIVDSRVIRETGGSSNTSVRIPEVDKMIDKAMLETDPAKSATLWGDIDKRVMEEAVIYPGLWAKALTLRGKNVTNVFISNTWGMYDYTAMGVAQ
jgi:peptide/nickel transport system substrate-binding protein